MEIRQLTQAFISYVAELYRNKGIAAATDFYQGELRILNFLSARTAPETSGNIGVALHFTSARTAAVLKALEQKDYILRTPDTVDKRRSLISLTGRGRDYVEGKREQLSALSEQMLNLLGQEDAEQFVRIMGKLRRLQLQTF